MNPVAVARFPSVLFAHDFDPAGVHIGWREAIRRAGGYAWVAATKSFIHRSDYDHVAGRPEVIMVCPGVGSGTGDLEKEIRDAGVVESRDLEDVERAAISYIPEWVERILASYPDAKRVALFHGSPHTRAWAARYAVHWHDRGFALAATTVDYAEVMTRALPVGSYVAWLPPLADRVAISRDHDEKDPIVVLQTPSDPVQCSTQLFLNATRTAGAIPLVSSRLPHGRNLWLKSRFPCGFDHFRGAPSLNALENAACGQASIFGLSDSCREYLENSDVEVPSTAIDCSPGALESIFVKYVGKPNLVADAQEECFAWWEDHFSEENILDRLAAFFEELK